MSLRVYNTITNQIEEFKPIKENQVSLYTCGPTVYDYAHIGNFRSYIGEDLIKRYLKFKGYQVKHVMNITDIDDKTIKKSIVENKSLKDITTPYTEAFFEDLKCLNVDLADHYPYATEHIQEMINLIEKLLEKGYAYKKGASVYFSVSKFKNYGKLANINFDNLKVGISVDADEYDKNSVQDFVLWKETKEGEPSWDTPFGKGRPGWHIECSAMSMKYLGAHFDIHMGGVDNIFPHHENEIAQSQCANGEKYVNYWLHCQHLVVENQKMSKSAGNFYTLRELLQKGYEAPAIRYLLLSTHYRKMLNFTFEGLDNCKKSLKRIADFLLNLKENESKNSDDFKEIDDILESSKRDFIKFMDDDFNISGALSTVFDLTRKINSLNQHFSQNDTRKIFDYLKEINKVLGVLKFPENKESDIEQDIKIKINEREEARKNKDYSKADKIRDELKSKGIILIDTKEGVKWRKE